jgi:hypothetical protein
MPIASIYTAAGLEKCSNSIILNSLVTTTSQEVQKLLVVN